MTPQQRVVAISKLTNDPTLYALAGKVYGHLNARDALEHTIDAVLTDRRKHRDPLRSSRHIIAVSRRALMDARRDHSFASDHMAALEDQMVRFQAKHEMLGRILALL